MKSLYWAAAIIAVALLPLPYEMYAFIRIAVCSITGFAAIKIFQKDQININSFVCGFIAILFNPVFLPPFTRMNWIFIDIASILMLLYLASKDKSSSENEELKEFISSNLDKAEKKMDAHADNMIYVSIFTIALIGLLYIFFPRHH